MATADDWYVLHASKDELNLDLILSSGQIFSWHSVPALGSSSESMWRGVIRDRLYTLKQSSSHEIMYQVQPSVSGTTFDHCAILCDFFHMDSSISVSSMLKEWSDRDKVFRGKSSRCKGVRVLRVDPFEALVSFICSSNNNIGRITHMVHSLCSNFGKCIATVSDQHYYSFPTPESLCRKDCESRLRSLGFGYRAKYVHKCVQQVLERGGEQWLQSLKLLHYEEALALLKELSGVGRKVADCVCLMGLGHLEAVPVDTHMLQVTVRDYGLEVPHSLTDKTYSLISEHYRAVFGIRAGWAQAVFFASEIQERKSSKRLTTSKLTSRSKRAKQS